MPGRQFRADLGQRQVRLMSDKRQYRLAMPTQARAMVTTHGPGARLTLGTYGHVIDELDEAPRIAAEDAIRAARGTPCAIGVPSTDGRKRGAGASEA